MSLEETYAVLCLVSSCIAFATGAFYRKVWDRLRIDAEELQAAESNDELVYSEDLIPLFADVPEDYFVYNLSQTPEFMLWHCTIVRWRDTPEGGEAVQCNENDTAAGALRCCLSKIQAGAPLCNQPCGPESSEDPA